MNRRTATSIPLEAADGADAANAPQAADAGPRVGFVVSKAVGNAVVRNRTKRVLRHLMAERLHRLTRAGALDVVVRANPAAAGATTRDLAADLDRNLDVALRKLEVR